MGILRRRRYRERLIPRRLPARESSRAASWALRLAIFAPVLAVVSILAHRISIIDTNVLLVLAVIVLIVALVGGLLVLVAFHSLWWKGKKGGRQTLWALFLSILVLSPYAYAGYAAVTNPVQAEVSTDLVDPPLFAEEVRLGQPNTSAVVAGQLSDGYPDLTGRRYEVSPDLIRETILKVAADMGWVLVDRRGRVGASDDVFFEFSKASPVLGIPGQVVLRLTDEGDTSFVDMRARIDYVAHDLGRNARLIEDYLSALDYELIGVVER